MGWETFPSEIQKSQTTMGTPATEGGAFRGQNLEEEQGLTRARAGLVGEEIAQIRLLKERSLIPREGY